MKLPEPTRREWFAAAAVTAGAALTASALAEPATKPAETEQPSDAQIDTAAELIGRTFSEKDKAQMRGALRRRKAVLEDVRGLDLPLGLEPALVFDPVLPGTMPTGMVEFTPPTADVPAFDNVEALAFATVPQLAAALDAGAVTSVALTRMYLERLKRLGPKLNCVVTLTEEFALEQAQRADDERRNGKVRSPLHGIPYGVKDLFATAGIPTTFGVSPFKTQTFDDNATIVQRLADAGAVLVAKLSLGELAMGDVWFGGMTRNPWNIEEGSSGSSAGSAAATAAGLVGFAIGTETLGSIVAPCVRCGTFGLRPTYGRVPRTGGMPLARSMDKPGPIARSVDCLTLILHAIAGPDGHDPACHVIPCGYDGNIDGIRVGFDVEAFKTSTTYAAALDVARATFGELVPVNFPDEPRLGAITGTTIAVESAESFVELTEGGKLDELVQQDGWNWPNAFRAASLIPAVEYMRIQRLRRRVMEQYAAATQDVDVFLTVPLTQPNMSMTNLTGQPSCVTRWDMNEGKPRQIEFIGKLYGEAQLLAVASAWDNAVGTAAWPTLT